MDKGFEHACKNFVKYLEDEMEGHKCMTKTEKDPEKKNEFNIRWQELKTVRLYVEEIMMNKITFSKNEDCFECGQPTKDGAIYCGETCQKQAASVYG